MSYKKICMLGLGYIGLPTACTLASCNIKVIGVDVNQRILDSLKNGVIHIHEPGLQKIFHEAQQSKKLVIQREPEEADVFIIAVPTPFTEGKHADLSFVKSAAESIVPYLQSGNLVVLESTSPPCTTKDVLAPILEKSGLRAGDDFYLVYSPERVLPGKIMEELVNNARVIGGVNEESAQAGKNLYSTFVKGEIILTDATTAEMVKLMENTYRDINIAIANEFSRLGDLFGVDVWEAISIANKHPRVNILSPGPGVGGHCIGVDPWFLVEAAPEITPLIKTARMVNDSQPSYVMDIIKRVLKAEDVSDLEGKRISVLGLTYKAEVDDLRQSPALEIVGKLIEWGVDVKAYDPYVRSGEIQGVSLTGSLQNTLKNAELIVLLVSHMKFSEINPEEIAEYTQARIIVDAVNALSIHDWQKAGFEVVKLGTNSAGKN